jgi:plastocyanin
MLAPDQRRHRLRAVFSAIAAAVCFFTAVDRLAAADDSGRQEPAATVEIVGIEYRPAKVTIHTGEAVEWKNNSWFTHTVTAQPSLADDKKDVQLPDGAVPFHSGDILKGETFSHTFTVPGTYRYFCMPHENKGMVGEVIVEK